MLAGALAAARWPEAVAPFVVAAVAAVLVALRGRRAVVWLAALALSAAAVGGLRVRGLLTPRLPATHVARLTLPLPTTVEGRLVAAPERNGRRVLLELEI